MKTAISILLVIGGTLAAQTPPMPADYDGVLKTLGREITRVTF